MRWKSLALEYEMKIRYLERALAQEESKLRIAEQVSPTAINGRVHARSQSQVGVIFSLLAVGRGVWVFACTIRASLKT